MPLSIIITEEVVLIKMALENRDYLSLGLSVTFKDRTPRMIRGAQPQIYNTHTKRTVWNGNFLKEIVRKRDLVLTMTHSVM